jgi:hypothetical protein
MTMVVVWCLIGSTVLGLSYAFWHLFTCRICGFRRSEDGKTHVR